ncbi:AzlC family ABC transporter permease [Mangrovicella endophytica]|uniref:AzlC family ABC transporter permease n=1 Tax=Mangrovicella endophytica TaxID=2066697 RepID=UPI000C9E4DB9|nr:AzlC family ABC transporter permease [Mangrovicella endophytica]
MSPNHAADADASGDARYWALQGLKGLFSVPALILMTAHVGFAGLARGAGIDWMEATFMVATIWALPANIVLIGAVTAGTSLAGTALAVALSSLRLMPMVVALMPELRGARTRTLLFLSHFVAVTGWVFAMRTLHEVPRRHRTVYFGAFGGSLCLINAVIVAIAFNLLSQLPALATGALAFLTPVYFLCSLYGSAREPSGRIGLFTGMAALPVANWLDPSSDILVAGLAGGIIAYVAGRIVETRVGA